MKWLVTTQAAVAEADLDEALARASAHRAEGLSPVPLGADERVWQVDGPPNLDSRLAGVEAIREVYPSSEFTLD